MILTVLWKANAVASMQGKEAARAWCRGFTFAQHAEIEILLHLAQFRQNVLESVFIPVEHWALFWRFASSIGSNAARPRATNSTMADFPSSVPARWRKHGPLRIVQRAGSHYRNHTDNPLIGGSRIKVRSCNRKTQQQTHAGEGAQNVL